MAPPRDTGFAASDAADDFLRARRRQSLSRLAGRLGRGVDVHLILPFDEVVEALGRVGERNLGLQTIPLDSVGGTVDRPEGFDRQFRPTSSRVRARWERVANAVRRGESMPPISVYRIGEVHFVRDGHHRVSVARAMDLDVIDAYVTEVTTRVGAQHALSLADLPLKSHERVFRERVPLPAETQERVTLTDAWGYARLAEGVEAWAFRRAQERDLHLGREEAARAWFDEEYVPVVEMLHEAGLVAPGFTEADSYMRVAEERYRLMRTHEWSPEVLARLNPK